MPICMICNRELGQINNRHLKSHNISAVEYKEKFPGAILIPMSEKCNNAARKNRFDYAQSEQHKQIMIKRNKSSEMKEKVSKKLKGKPKSEAHKQALRDAKTKSMHKHKNTRGKSGIRIDIGHYVRSTWEANFARILQYLNIDYKYEKKRFLIIYPNGENHYYIPDFTTNNYIVEVKGYWFKDAQEKFKLFKEQYPEIRVHIIEKVKYNQYKKKFESKVNWE